jgi:hypothetical protein
MGNAGGTMGSGMQSNRILAMGRWLHDGQHNVIGALDEVIICTSDFCFYC